MDSVHSLSSWMGYKVGHSHMHTYAHTHARTCVQMGRKIGMAELGQIVSRVAGATLSPTVRLWLISCGFG